VTVESVSVALVMAQTMSKTCRPPITPVTMRNAVMGATSGHVTFRSTPTRVAPSTSAASYRLSLTPESAARYSTMQ
jgi:hypothetical protein